MIGVLRRTPNLNPTRPHSSQRWTVLWHCDQIRFRAPFEFLKQTNYLTISSVLSSSAAGLASVIASCSTISGIIVHCASG